MQCSLARVEGWITCIFLPTGKWAASESAWEGYAKAIGLKILNISILGLSSTRKV